MALNSSQQTAWKAALVTGLQLPRPRDKAHGDHKAQGLGWHEGRSCSARKSRTHVQSRRFLSRRQFKRPDCLEKLKQSSCTTFIVAAGKLETSFGHGRPGQGDLKTHGVACIPRSSILNFHGNRRAATWEESPKSSARELLGKERAHIPDLAAETAAREREPTENFPE